MPKIVARSLVCNDKNSDIDQKNLNVYHCLCGELCLIINKPLELLPFRKKDKSRVVDTKELIYKLKLNDDDDLVYLKRENGIEKQYRKKCKNCGLFILYKPESNSDLLFVVDGSLVEQSINNFNQNQYNRNDNRKFYRNDNGKFSIVSVSTMDEEAEEIESKEASESYELNSKIIQKQLEKSMPIKKRKDESEDTIEYVQKKVKGTLIN